MLPGALKRRSTHSRENLKEKVRWVEAACRSSLGIERGILSVEVLGEREGLCELERVLEVLMMLLNRPHFFLPASSIASSSDEFDCADVGRASGTIPERRFMALDWPAGFLSAILSKERSAVLEAERLGSVRMISKRRPGAGLHGAVDGCGD